MPRPRSVARKSRPCSSTQGRARPRRAARCGWRRRRSRSASRLQAPDPRRRLELDVDALRPVLEEPGAGVVARVVAVDELAQLLVLDAAALDARKRAGAPGCGRRACTSRRARRARASRSSAARWATSSARRRRCRPCARFCALGDARRCSVEPAQRPARARSSRCPGQRPPAKPTWPPCAGCQSVTHGPTSPRPRQRRARAGTDRCARSAPAPECGCGAGAAWPSRARSSRRRRESRAAAR